MVVLVTPVLLLCSTSVIMYMVPFILGSAWAMLMEEPMRVMATKQDNLFILFSFYVFFLIGDGVFG
jgi:hypothetical protein